MGRNLQDKVIVIAGGSSGIGAATAVACAEAGMHVALGARREAKLRAVAEQIEALGRRVVTVQCDVCRDEDVAHLFEQAWDAFGRLDVAFANAGYGHFGSVLGMSDRQHRDIFETNYFGTLRVIREAVPRLRQTPDGLKHVLICSSAASEVGLPMFGAYSATKAAQDSIAGAMRAEVAAEGIAVTSIHPVGTKTDFFTVAEQMGGVSGAGSPNTPGAFTQTPQRVAKSIVKAIRRPRAEVWPLPLARIGLGFSTIVPGITAYFMKRSVKQFTPAGMREEGATTGTAVCPAPSPGSSSESSRQDVSS